jgi:rhodanese-related sulfurtransferase
MFLGNTEEENTRLVENLDTAKFQKELTQDINAVLIDVRTQQEHNLARIPNSILIDFYSPLFLHEIDKLTRDKNYYLYCRRGNRSYYAGNQMLKMGFSKVCHLHPGIIGWNGDVESF